MGIGTHQSAKALTEEWLTPPEIIKALGPFGPEADTFRELAQFIIERES